MTKVRGSSGRRRTSQTSESENDDQCAWQQWSSQNKPNKRERKLLLLLLPLLLLLLLLLRLQLLATAIATATATDYLMSHLIAHDCCCCCRRRRCRCCCCLLPAACCLPTSGHAFLPTHAAPRPPAPVSCTGSRSKETVRRVPGHLKHAVRPKSLAPEQPKSMW